MLASVSMSACKPAPPEGSVAANVSTMGGKAGSVSSGMGIEERGRASRVGTLPPRGDGAC